MRIEDHDGGELWDRRPGSGPAPDHDRPARPGLVPRPGRRIAPTDEASRETLGPSRRGHEHQDGAIPRPHAGVIDDAQHEVDQIRGGREPEHGRSGLRQRRTPQWRDIRVVGRMRRRLGTRRQPWRTREPAYHRGRRRRPQEEGLRSGPAPCRPPGQLDHGRGRSPSQPRLEREDVDPLEGRHVVLGDPAADAAPVERGTHARAHLDLVIPLGRHRVVERLAQCGHLGAHPDSAEGARHRRRARHDVGGTTGTAPFKGAAGRSEPECGP